MILEWDVPFVLISPVNAADTTPAPGPLPFNDLASIGVDPLGYFLLDSSKCSSGAARRITRNNLAQANGEITHRKFKSGYVIQLNAQFWERSGAEGIPACAGVLREMGDLLGEYLEAIANADGQLVWFPSAWPDDAPAPNPRMLDMARSMGPSGDGPESFVSVVQEKDPDGPLTTATFALLSPLPYATDYMNWPTTPDETVTFATEDPPAPFVQPADARVTIVNEGNVDFHPKFRIHGPADFCTIINYSVVDEVGNPLQIVYDSSLRGGTTIPTGAYLEIDTFRSTARMRFAGGGFANMKASIDVTLTDFFTLAPGNNDLFVNKAFPPAPYDGPGVDVIYRNAWT